MIRRRHAMYPFVLFVLLSAVLTACWDKSEMNELALVSMVGVDSDPQSGKKTIYYQIINPLSGTSAKGTPGGEQASVYTYEISGSSYGEIKTTVYKLLPRKLFVAHYKALVVSERAARQGIRDFVNFVEMQPNGRSSVPMLIADVPLSQIMKNFTPLERVPSDTVDARLKLLIRNSLIVGKNVKVNNVIERMQRADMIVLPMISKRTGNTNQDSGKTAADIDANKNNFVVGGGAVIRDYRMVGKLDDAHLVWYHLLDGDRGRHVQQFQINGKSASVEMKLTHMERKVRWHADKPVVTIRLDLELSTAFASEFVPQSAREIEQLENKMNQMIAGELNAFYRETKKRGWDLLNIADLLERSGAPKREIAAAAKNAVVQFGVSTKLLHTGSMTKPY